MRLAISNIAWGAGDDDAVAEALRAEGVDRIEVAPTTRWPDPALATTRDAAAWRGEWQRRGLRPVSAQSVFYGKPGLAIFGADADRQAALEYLSHVMGLAADLGVGPIVFGSPANRRVGDMDRAVATSVAVEFFAAAGARARELGVVLCLEPNPPQYGCDFLTDTASCVDFLEQVGEEGLALHLDAAALALNGEDVARALDRAGAWLRHYHASEPYLAPLGTAGVAHAEHARALEAHGYGGLVSIEMKPVADDGVEHVRRAVRFARAAYAPLLDRR